MRASFNFLRQELRKILRCNSFRIILMLLILLVIVDGGFAIQNYNNETAATLAIPKDSAGLFTEDPWIGVATLYNSWIGGRTNGVLPLLFYFLSPIFCVIPYSWSYQSEEKSGYIKLICSKIGKFSYVTVKYLSSFLSGFFIVVIPQLISILFMACFVPAYKPDMTYALYNQVDMSTMWGDLYYTVPYLYVALYVLISGLFGGIWATVPVAVSMFHKNKFAALFAPYIVLLFFISAGEESLVFRGYYAVSPLELIRPTMQGQAEYSWIFALELLIIAVPTLAIILWRGRKKDVF